MLHPPPKDFVPPRNASQRQRRQWRAEMQAWLADVDAQNIAAMDRANAPDLIDLAKSFARAGSPELLRKLVPEYADFIHSPPRKKYQRQGYAARLRSLAEVGADFARRIHALWQEEYGRQRTPVGELKAEDFAVAILKGMYKDKAAGLTVDAVLRAAKPSGTPRALRKSPPHKGK